MSRRAGGMSLRAGTLPVLSKFKSENTKGERETVRLFFQLKATKGRDGMNPCNASSFLPQAKAEPPLCDNRVIKKLLPY
jgi:hypothetical protein